MTGAGEGTGGPLQGSQIQEKECNTPLLEMMETGCLEFPGGAEDWQGRGFKYRHTLLLYVQEPVSQ